MLMNSLSNPYYIIILLYIVVIGLCFGSFLNVVILRGLSGESFLFERSKCPKCQKQLKWYMNIPIFSYIFLKGKCAFCKSKISIQYPIVEALNAILFLISFLYFGLTIKAMFICAFLFMFLALSITDIKQKVIIDYHAYILTFLGLIYSLLGFSDINILNSILGAVVGFLVIEGIARITKILIQQRAFGEGDSLITLALGSIFGYKAVCLIIVFAIVLQGILALPVLAYSAFKNKNLKLYLSYILTSLAFVYLIFANIYKLDRFAYFYMISVILLSIILIWALKNILNSIKERNLNPDDDDYQSNVSFLPFGPALIISATLFLFFMDNFKEFILNFFNCYF